MQAITFFRWVTLSSYFGLISFIFTWLLWIQPPAPEFRSMALLVQLGPLLFPLRGILHGKAYTHAWASYLALFYLVVGVWYAGGADTRTYGILISLLSVSLFVGCVMYARFRGKLNKIENKSI